MLMDIHAPQALDGSKEFVVGHTDMMTWEAQLCQHHAAAGLTPDRSSRVHRT